MIARRLAGRQYLARAALVALLALTIRLGWLASTLVVSGEGGLFEPDSVSYVNAARGLASGRGFAEETEGGWRAVTMRTPGYPALLAFAMLVAGSGWLWLAVALQVLADVSIVLAFRVVGEPGMSERESLAAGLLYGMSVVPSIMSTRVMSDSLFAALATWGVALLVRAWRSTAPAAALRVACLGGVLLGLAALTRPVGLYPVVAWLVGMALIGVIRSPARLAAWRDCVLGAGEPPSRPSLRPPAAALACVIVLAGAWVLRNGLGVGYWGLASIDYTNLLFYRAAGAEAAATGVPFEEVKARYQVRYRVANPWDQSEAGLERGNALRLEALRIMAAYPGGYLRQAALGMWRIGLDPGLRELQTSLGEKLGDRLRRPARVALVVIWLAVAVGVLTRPATWPWGALVLLLMLASAGPEAYSRFRTAVEPFMALAASAGVGSTFRFARRIWSESGGR